MQDKTIGGHDYRIGHMNARKQAHVVRRLFPALVSVIGLTGLKDVKDLDVKDVATKIGPFTEAISQMKDEDVDYVIDTCLGVVQRSMGESRGWANVMAPGGAMMFEDIDLADMMELVFAVVGENLDGFFDALRSRFQALGSQEA